MLLRIMIMSHIVPYFSPTLTQLWCSTPSLPPVLCQKRGQHPILPVFNIMIYTAFLQLSTCKISRWQASLLLRKQRDLHAIPPGKAGGNLPLSSSSTLLHYAFHNWIGSCFFPLEYLQEFSISLAQLSKVFSTLTYQVVAENMGAVASRLVFISQFYHWLLMWPWEKHLFVQSNA